MLQLLEILEGRFVGLVLLLNGSSEVLYHLLLIFADLERVLQLDLHLAQLHLQELLLLQNYTWLNRFIVSAIMNIFVR